MRAPVLILIAQIVLLGFCQVAQAGISKQAWGAIDQQPVYLYTLTNQNGVEVRITNYGGVITSILVPDRNGKLGNVVEGFDNLNDYMGPGFNGRYGATIGRFANRIKDNAFVLDGVTYRTTRDAKPYDQRVWNADVTDGAEPTLTLALTDPDGTMGFPGTVHVQVSYTLTKKNVLRLDYRATTDKDTIVNLTNHSYFNMAGSSNVLDERLTINADYITLSDEQNVPTGETRRVDGTPFDFHAPTPIGLRIDAPDDMLKRAGGYDLNFVINGDPGQLRFAARLEDPKSGRSLEEWTTQPGVQVYTANIKPGPAAAAKGYVQHSAVAMEAEHAPNSPNIASFTSPIITPNKPLHEITEFRFLADGKSP